MKAPRDLLAVAEFLDDDRDNLRQQDVVLIWAKLLPLQIEPAEQLLFLGGEFDETHAVTAVAAVAALMGAQRIPHTLRVQFDCTFRQSGFQLVHVLEREVDRLRGAAQFFGHAAGIDGGKAVVTQYRHRSVDDLFP